MGIHGVTCIAITIGAVSVPPEGGGGVDIRWRLRTLRAVPLMVLFTGCQGHVLRLTDIGCKWIRILDFGS